MKWIRYWQEAWPMHWASVTGLEHFCRSRSGWCFGIGSYPDLCSMEKGMEPRFLYGAFSGVYILRRNQPGNRGKNSSPTDGAAVGPDRTVYRPGGSWLNTGGPAWEQFLFIGRTKGPYSCFRSEMRTIPARSWYCPSDRRPETGGWLF